MKRKMKNIDNDEDRDEEDEKGKEAEDGSRKKEVYLYDMDVWSYWISFLEISKRNDDIN